MFKHHSNTKKYYLYTLFLTYFIVYILLRLDCSTKTHKLCTHLKFVRSIMSQPNTVSLHSSVEADNWEHNISSRPRELEVHVWLRVGHQSLVEHRASKDRSTEEAMCVSCSNTK